VDQPVFILGDLRDHPDGYPEAWDLWNCCFYGVDKKDDWRAENPMRAEIEAADDYKDFRPRAKSVRVVASPLLGLRSIEDVVGLARRLGIKTRSEQ